MVPKGWKKRDLHKLITIKHGFAFKSEYFSNDGQYVLLTPGSFNESGGFRNQGPKTKFYSGPIPNGYLLSKGDLLLAMTEQAEGLLGSPLFVPEDNKYLHNQRLGLVEINCPDKICSDFLYLLFNHADSRKQITEQSTGTKVKHTSPDRLCSVIGLIPPLLEQKKIAQILSTWDKAISVTEKLLANSQQQKKALMQQLLTGKKRLLNENGVRFSTEWEFKRISEIATRVQRKNDAAEHPILTISSLSGFVRQDERYSRYMAGESVKNYILLKKGEFAYNKGNSKTYEFGCIFDLEAYEAGLVPHVYVCFRLKNGLSHRYFKYLFEADYLKPQLGALVNTGVRNNGLLNIKPTEFMQTKVPVPCFEEQESIADMLYNSSRTIRVLQDKLACLKDEKKALMQQLLTGKRRVKVDEAVAV
ncbi:TPA: restriction endonuclease subunit S [Escherichia coli]|uniref:Restriction endonuclease subunit S n=3 Tax=Enterobacteriaceae TaxID=543 RepID=A0A839AZW2_ECOLX|nr:restriction endonuclease subunit S [Escherichia coli]WQI92279.1 restriction endonuclease subunit S [Citrobacter freundii]EFK2851783.1 restriction endonuclease subunit S [Escherichia coli]EFL9482783.1 restriction endonuclease subunit S [Escherichia coli]EFN4500868.1 restriction endonuclease subunit S [Escherichia coli]EGI4259509.1 restriction endonuclease subunit S [Escherichia coli]